jgi:AcrR family transcriptional regulator
MGDEAADHPDTREALTRSAARLFAERGYDAVSVREIVEAAGVTKPALYYYFGNKEGLARAVLDEMVVAAVAVRDRAFKEATSPKQAFVMHGSGMLELSIRYRHTLAFGFSLQFGRSSLEGLVQYAMDVHQSFTRAWMELLTGMGLSEPKAALAVRSFWALMQQEMMTAASCTAYDEDVGQAAERIAHVALYGALSYEHES